jgi:glucose/arabinose dehydrogenase
MARRHATCQHAPMSSTPAPGVSRAVAAAGTILVAALVVAMLSTPSTIASPTPGAASTTMRPTLRLVPVPGVTFTAPVWVGSAPGSGTTYHVVEQRGLVWAVTGRRKVRFLDVRGMVAASGEQGLLSMAFARDYATSGRFYVYFTARDGSGQVWQHRARGGRVVVGSGRRVIRFPLDPPAATNHNGGNLWTTAAGHLLLSIGDGGGGGVEVRSSQRMDRLMGKLIRITPRASGGYVVPRSNPFFTRPGARREIYALGLRNPWRFSVDEPTGDIWIGDVGQNEREEVNRMAGGRPAGANFGWPRMEGTRLFSSSVALATGTRHAPPMLEYGRSGGRCSVTGGVVYRGPVTSLRGHYLYADFCSDRIWSLHPTTRRRAEHAGTGGIVHFGAVAGGNVLVASVTQGRLYRIAAS